MKTRLSVLLTAAVLLLSACGPQTFRVYYQVRQPSRAGLDLSKKTMSVVYLSDPDTTVSALACRQATELARTLEENYFDGKTAVGFYELEKDPAGDYSQTDTLIRMVVGTGDDVVFLLETPDMSAPSVYQIYALDSMSGSDQVLKFAGSGTVGEEFVPNWKYVAFEVIYFESSGKWTQACGAVDDGNWDYALKLWMELAGQGKNMIRRAGACYDAAIACYLLGDKPLAYKWLDRADAACPLEESQSLRRLFNTLK